MVCRKPDAGTGGLEQSEASYVASLFKNTTSNQGSSCVRDEEREKPSQHHSEENLLRRFRESLDLDAKQRSGEGASGASGSRPGGEDSEFSQNWNDISSGSFCMGTNTISDTTARLKNMRIRNSKSSGQRINLRKLKKESSGGVDNVSICLKKQLKEHSQGRWGEKIKYAWMVQISQKLSGINLKFPGKSRENENDVLGMCDQLKNVKIDLFQPRDTSDTKRGESRKEGVSEGFSFFISTFPNFPGRRPYSENLSVGFYRSLLVLVNRYNAPPGITKKLKSQAP